MILLIIGKKQLTILERIMQLTLEQGRALIEKIALGNAADPQVKADIEVLKTGLAANATADAENKAADEVTHTLLAELLERLAESTPPAPPPAPVLLAPTVTDLSPASGSVAGGESITLTGKDFTGATAVEFGTVPAESFEVTNDTTIVAVTPAQQAGTTLHVTVTNAVGKSVNAPENIYTWN